MNIKKSSLWMLSLVLGVSVILYIFDAPIIPSSTQMVPTITMPSVAPTITTTLVEPTLVKAAVPTSNSKSLSSLVDYQAEGRSESIAVSITLSGSIVTEVSSVHSMNDGKSRQYQNAFEAEIRPLVIGKDIKTLNLSRVAGASFTTDAFMQAINTMKAQI